MTEKNDLSVKLPKVRGEYKFSEPLSKYVWLKVGGPADVIFFPQDKEDLQFFLQNKPDGLSVFTLGGGSNLLVRDGGICGAVVKLQNDNFKNIRIEKDRIYCGAGMINSALKKVVAENGLGGLEFLCSIPGSLGGMFRSNAGCFGSDLSTVLKKATVINGKGDIFEADCKDFNFGYRHSDFPADWIVLEVCLQFEKKDAQEVRKQIQANDEYRQTHQPQGIRTAGSTFKNPEGYRAWELIKNSGGADMVVGGARMSAQHCNFLQADNTATAADIEKLGRNIIAAVKEKTGVDLEWEIKIIGQE